MSLTTCSAIPRLFQRNYPCTPWNHPILGRLLDGAMANVTPRDTLGIVGDSMISLFADIAQDLTVVESTMREQLHSDEPRVAELIAQLGDFHGKMLRPALLLLTARGMGAVEKHHHRLAAALELIHTATLIHDDMIDGGELRRGKPTPHVSFGNSTAILLGDFFYTRAFDLVAGVGDSWMTKTITATTNVICEGELLQMIAQRDAGLSRAEYDRIIYAKTAVLCETACQLGAANGTEAQRQAAGAYGKACGIAFQIVDDCLDLVGDPEKVGKSLTSDIERGRLTLPFLAVLEQTTSEQERSQLAKRFLTVEAPEDVETIRQLVVAKGGVDLALTEAKAAVAEATEQLASLPPGPNRDTLAQLADFIVSRDF